MGEIRVEGLTKSYGSTQVLRRMSLAVADKSTLTILGPSGQGKTTLLRIIAGLDLPDEGEVYLGGKLVTRPGWATLPHTRGIGFLFQGAALWPHMTVTQNILFGIQDLPKAVAGARVVELLAATELTGLGDRYPDQISGGQARRVALARALAPNPPYLLLDEPMTHVEVALKDRLLMLVRGHAAATGATMVWVTHEPAEAEALGGAVMVLGEDGDAEGSGK